MAKFFFVCMLGLLIGCSGSSTNEGIISTNPNPAPTGPPNVNQSPQSIIEKFQNIGISISCTQNENCATANASGLNAMYASYNSFLQQKSVIATVALDGTDSNTYFDKLTRAVTFPTSVTATEVTSFFTLLSQVAAIENEMHLQFSFTSEPFMSSTVGPILNVVYQNKTALAPYESKLTWIECLSGDTFASGIWSVDCSQLVTDFSGELKTVDSEM